MYIYRMVCVSYNKAMDEYDLITNDATDLSIILKDCLQKSFMEAAIRRLKKMESWYTSMEVHFIQRTKKSA